MTRSWSPLALCALLLASAGPLAAQTPPAAPTAPAAAAGTPGATATEASVRGDNSIVVDEKNRSLIIRTTPSKHRKIQALLARITQDPNQGHNLKTQVFNLMNLSQQEFFDLVKYQTGLNPEDKDKFLVLRESRNRPPFVNTIPATKLLPTLPLAGGGATTGGSFSSGASAGAGAGAGAATGGTPGAGAVGSQ